jgi:hypothetical protein
MKAETAETDPICECAKIFEDYRRLHARTKRAIFVIFERKREFSAQSSEKPGKKCDSHD